MELGTFGGATLDRIVWEIPPVDGGREPGEDLENGNGNWWSRVTVAGISWGCREDTGL